MKKRLAVRAGIMPVALLLSACLVAACSGGSDAAAPALATAVPTPPPPPPPPPAAVSGPTWTAGVFEPASTFADQCEVVRTGRDIEGNTFPDQAGSLLEENFWLRSWTDETYLWNTEVTDRDPAGFDNRLDYFAVLRTTAITASGEDKDDFHFSEPTERFLERRTSAARAGYGARLVAFSSNVPRDYRVQYTEPGTPASETVLGDVNLKRGTRILEVDGVDLVNATAQAELDTLNAGLFPATSGERHVFLVQDVGSNDTREITLISDDITPKPVNRISVLDTPTGKVGYILFNTFSPFASEQEIAEAIGTLNTAGVSDLVLDLRYNGGGLLAVASQLSFMIAGNARTRGKTFERLRFNSSAGNRNPVTGGSNDPIPFYDSGLGFSLANGENLDSLDLPRVFILSTGSTCSASEAVINGLRGIDVEVILIGDTTCGKPFGFYPEDNCGETYYTIQFQGVNEKGFGDYADGFVPDASSSGFGVKLSGCTVPDDYSRELGDDSEALLAAALQYRDTGTCPATSSLTVRAGITERGAISSEVTITDLNPDDELLANNRDMTMPY